MRALIVVIVVNHATIAAADPPPPSPRTTLYLSLGTTTAGLALALVAADVGIRPQAYPSGATNTLEPVLATIGVAGLLVGPSLGRAYGHADLWNTGTALRVVGLGIFGAGAVAALARGSSGSGGLVLIAAGAGVGGAVYVSGAVIEIATTPSAVERHNRVAPAPALTITITPIRSPSGTLVPAFGLAGRF